MDHVANFIGDKTAEEIKEINFYKSGQVIDYWFLNTTHCNNSTKWLYKPIENKFWRKFAWLYFDKNALYNFSDMVRAYPFSKGRVFEKKGEVHAMAT